MSFLLWMAAFLAVFGLLRLAGGPPSGRYRQAFLPLAAVAYGAAAGWAYREFFQPFLDFLQHLEALLAPVLAPLNGTLKISGYPLLAFNLAALAGFVGLKPLVRTGCAGLLELLRRFSRERPDSRPDVLELALSPAYERDPEQGIVLDARWIYGQQACLGFLSAAVALLAALAAQVLYGFAWPVPALPALPALLFLETVLYLGGPRRAAMDAPEGGPAGPDPASGDYDYAALWQSYQDLWPKRALHAGEVRPDRGGQGLAAALAAVERDLEAGVNLLIKANEPTPALPALARRARRLLAEGGVVLILVSRGDQAEALAQALARNTVDPAGEPSARRVADLSLFLKDRAGTDLLVATPDALLLGQVLADPWFARLRLLVVPDLEAAFAGIAALDNVLCQARARAEVPLQHVLLSHERHAIQPAVGRNFRLNTVEHVLQSAFPERVWTLAWPAEREPWLQQALLLGSVGTYLGNEMILALPAWRRGFAPIRIFGVAAVPWLEQREELQNDLAQIRPEWRVDPRGSDLATQRLAIGLNPRLYPPAPGGCVVVRDAANNLSTALVSAMGKGEGELLLHVVSPPYLLRDYLAANLGYFLAAPLRALTPRKTVGLATVADSLWQRLTIGEVEEAAVLSELREYDSAIRFAESGLQRLFFEAYGIDIVQDDLLLLRVESRFRFEDGEGSFAEVVLLSLKRGAADPGRGPGGHLFRLCSENGENLGVASASQISRRYLPGQIHVFGGRAYRVGRIDHVARSLRLHHCQPQGEVCYRRVLRVAVQGIRTMNNSEAVSRVRRKGLTVTRELCEGDFTVSTDGYYTRGDDLRSNGEGAYRDLLSPENRVADRHWPRGRVLRLVLELPEESRPNAARVAFSLAALLTEVLPTLLPEIHDSLIVGTLLPDGFLSTPGLESWFPRLVREPSPAPAIAPTAVEILVLEDDQHDTGGIQCLFDKLEMVFEVIYDYLAWSLAQESRPFLAYGLDAVPAELDLPAALAFLERLGLGCGPDSIQANRLAAMANGESAGPGAVSGGAGMPLRSQ